VHQRWELARVFEILNVRNLKLPLLISILIVAIFFAAGAGKHTQEERLLVATFDIDVTPPIGSAMAYTMVEKNPELSLRCRGIVILGSGDPIVMCAIDWIGVANEGYDAFRDQLAAAAGTTRSRVTLHALHQHDAPGCDFTAEKLVKELGLKGYERTHGDFHREVINRAANAIKAAIPMAQQVTHYGWGEAEVEKVASNRRLLGSDGKVRAVRYTATKDPALRAEPEGVIDPEVSLLSFWNEKTPVAVLSYYACHPQSYYRTGTPSPDFPGIARFMRGQGVPEALHVHFNGAGGNLGAGKYNDGNTENRMILAGRMAEGMLKAWRATKKKPLTADAISFAVEKVRLPIADHLKDEKSLMEALRKDPPRGYFSKVDQIAYLRHWKAGNQIDVSCLSVGDSRVLHMPGELFVEYQLAAKAMRPDLNIAMAAYGEYGPGYIGTKIAYSEGGYETSPSASAVGPGSEKVLTAAMKTLLGEPARKQGRVAPKSPKEAIAAFETLPGFEMQLVASEPQIREPIVVTYDENGLMYAAEYLKFPSHGGKSDGPDGRIRLLRDSDGDGHYETSQVFADGIAWPTGICCWDGGVYVVAAPDLWYLKDTDDDGIADVREKIFTGFGFRNDEGTANNLYWGLDSWIYGAGSNSGGNIQSLQNKETKPVSIRGRDFRFHPRTREFQALSGSEQFGNAMDDWGNRFLSQNSKPAVHVVLPSRYLGRNPYLSIPSTKTDIWKGNTIFRASEIEGWRLARTKIRLADDRKYSAPSVAHDVFSGCSGVNIYRGSVYPEEFHGNLFVGDVQGNLIHRRSLSPEGVTFASERIEKEGEFLRSTDNWFRPANLVNAPDGTFHIVDMYRETIETPDSMVPEILAMVDFRSGNEHGRVYRFAPKGFQPPPPPALGKATIAELVKTLQNPNGWWRDTASRLLFERGDRSALHPLRVLLETSDLPLARLHALHVIAGLDGLAESDLASALSDQSPGIREHALRLFRPEFMGLKQKVITLAGDDHIRVRYQAAFSLGDLEGEDVAGGLAKIAIRDEGDPWMRIAVLSAHPRLALPVFRRIQGAANQNSLLPPLTKILGARNERSELEAFLAIIEDAGPGFPLARMISNLGNGLKEAGSSLSEYPEVAKLTVKLAQNAKAILKDKEAQVSQKVEAVELLGNAPWGKVSSDLYRLLDSSQAPAVQLASLRILSGFKKSESGDVLIKLLLGLSPATRSEVIELLLSRDAWIAPLLAAVGDKKVTSGQIPLVHQKRLLEHKDPALKKKAQALFSAKANPRASVVKNYQAALKLSGDVERGRKVFSQSCLACHKLGEIGHEVGPTLTTVKSRSPESTLIQILDPNREVLTNFSQYFVTLNDGRTASGQIVGESSSSLTLRRAGGVEEIIFRQKIKSITGSGQSLMPEGLEGAIDLQAMSDLIAFLRS
jgi:putative membrane-bound dehydrogenase-like protein|tara:strand:- start:2031 stop:6281 length:4251 start_codon:yes stop_codon:yes gene_type:complete